MADLPERNQALLLDMLLAARDAQRFLQGIDKTQFLTSDLHQSAVIRKLEVTGEAAGKVSRSAMDAVSDIPWREITGMRHRLIQDYFDVNQELVWQVIQVEIPSLIQTLEGLVPPENEGSP